MSQKKVLRFSKNAPHAHTKTFADPSTCRCPKCGEEVDVHLAGMLSVDFSTGSGGEVNVTSIAPQSATLSCRECGELVECRRGDELVSASEFSIDNYDFEITATLRDE